MVMAIAASLWGCQAAGPIKVPLVTTAIPADTSTYMSPSVVALGGGDPNLGRFLLDEDHPTTKLTLGGIECIVKAQTPAKVDDHHLLHCKLLIKTPTQELTFDTPPSGSDATVELTLNHGRKYLLTGWGHCYSQTDPKTEKKSVITIGGFQPAGTQTGKIGQSTVALFDANLDGFYTSGQDGIVISSPSKVVDDRLPKFRLVQPLSKYISTSDGIFEVQHLAKDGSELTLLPYRGPTASLQVIAPQKYLGQIILTSPDANLNVTVSGKVGELVTVIPGNYTILVAELGIYPQSLLIYGDGMPSLKVATGAKQVLTLSGPKILEFQATMVYDKVNIKSDTFHITGQAGETYSPICCDQENPPEVYLNVDGKSTLLGKMAFG